ncbi:GyrI-like domain-containing protein [Streptomyces sp. NPDC052107]|uniref:GyrI-like domain-containing protein n=1 Tax=Streptomyces sp. NPDC052107 TaxID=3155632 RepID=UPI003429DBE4
MDPLVVPGAELAVAVHRGALHTIGLTYGDPGTYAARHEIGVDGPLREYYLRSPVDVARHDDLVTEVGWPIFRSVGQRWSEGAGGVNSGRRSPGRAFRCLARTAGCPNP